eukprot:CAMPEP_0172547142 /NCGR_PEP_ID=MMETSP1067-20121228/16743_1 /TAXON_ID=265564 ORGANISM="Thalassiosira punctigera, Strain Tpunct2005C2" /NCGR_SAMPLE_ID=MMETSP1067 /ASSEMBLY_ACC=CAM_ASM_000444 /LENGTH=65 /DNA_ID=CAMNT_0013334177 /DNA_START=65 /DNA_END=259 /DNA_ORIENTATION=+
MAAAANSNHSISDRKGTSETATSATVVRAMSTSEQKQQQGPHPLAEQQFQQPDQRWQQRQIAIIA